jgi:hypothetical protein
MEVHASEICPSHHRFRRKMNDIERNWHPKATGRGMYVLSFFESAGEVSPVFERKAREMFEEQGLTDIDPEEYYPIDDIAPAFYSVVDDIGDKTMRQGGRQMGRDVPWPDGVEEPHDGLQTIDAIHQEASPARENGRTLDVDRPAGGYTYERRDDAAARVGITERYPYPPVMAEGVFLGIVDGLHDGVVSVEAEPTDPTHDERRAWTLSWS